MADVGTLDILSEIQALVSDKLQVVSYKWLSRNFSVSSNDAKRMLQEFVEQHGNGLEVLYTLSGWLKKNPPVYHVKLISGLKLSEVRDEFEDNYSIQVYSVQPCIPKDPAVLWNAEFVQAEELFDQPANIDNCLRDNRFCGVSNSFVKRNANGKSSIVVAPQPKNVGSTALSKSSIPQQPHGKVQQASPKIGQSPAAQPALASTVKSESIASEANAQDANSLVDKEKDTAFPANKKNVKVEKSSSGTGSLSNLWGRALAKSKPCPQAETNEVASTPVVTAEAQIHAREAIDAVSSDDEANGIHHKRSSNGEGSRKRRVVFDFSDEEDDNKNAVNLASPDPPRRQSGEDSESHITNLIVGKNNLNLEAQKEDQLRVKQEKVTDREPSFSTTEETKVDSKNKSTGVSLPVKTPILIPEDSVNKKDKATEASSNSPKRRKVLKSRIDERGREVVEVVWEGEEIGNKTIDEKNGVVNAADKRPTGAKKSPALASNAPSNPVAKAGAKKTGKGAGTKDPKQGNILSFFKKV